MTSSLMNRSVLAGVLLVALASCSPSAPDSAAGSGLPGAVEGEPEVTGAAAPATATTGNGTLVATTEFNESTADGEGPGAESGYGGGSYIQRIETPTEIESADRIPALKSDQLPPLTRVKPDPSRTQYTLAAVFVRFSETLTDSGDVTERVEKPIIERYLQEYFRRAGHPIAASPGEAAYRIEGTLTGSYAKTVTFKGDVVAYQVAGEARVRVLDPAGEPLAEFELPSTKIDNTISERNAFVDLRRYVARLLWGFLFRESSYFGNSEVRRLMEGLVAGEVPGWEDPTTEKIVAALSRHGFDAVPHLLDGMTDVRTVTIPSSYPGVETLGAGLLKVYHVADKALEEIFQKVSRMDLETAPGHRFVVTRGWEDEWRRFCPPFRESTAKR